MNDKLRHILLVDDDPAAVTLARLALEEAGITVRLSVARGFDDGRRQLLAWAEQGMIQAPELVLLDLNLRDGSGHDLLALIRRHPQLERLVVVILSTSSRARDVGLAMELGADRYIVKPSEFGEFVEALEALVPLLEGRTGEGAAPVRPARAQNVPAEG